MKNACIALMVLFSLSLHQAEAQVSVHINIGRQPLWGPVGYDYAHYYYLPDIDVFYDVPRGLFVYFSGGRWLFSTSLPYRYHNYNLYNSYKVVINDRDPWMRHRYYYDHYREYRGHHQHVWRDSHDQHYWSERNKFRGGYDNGKGNGGRNNGRGHDRHGAANHGHKHGRGHD